MPSPIVLLDANLLIPALVRDLFLSAAERGLCRIHWSEDILAEVERHLPEFIHVGGDDSDAIARIRKEKATDAIATMNRAFPEALVINYRRHIARMTNDPKDRHVAAAAWQVRADIVTFNVRHFRAADLAPFKLRAVHPDLFLVSLFGSDAEAMAGIVRAIAAKRSRPVTTETELLKQLVKSGLGGFARAVRGHLEVR